MSTAIHFSVEQYDRMIESGVLDDAGNRRLELVCGEIREMTPPGPTHEEVVDLLNAWSVRNTDTSEIRIRIQNTIGIPALDSVPLPDVAWVRQKSYRGRRPSVRDVLLLIEVADTSLAYDLEEKLRLYAEAGIKEYWVVNIPHFQVEVFRDPRGREYQNKSIHGVHESVSPRASKNLKLAVSSLFGR
jgi:Uma2 family endonuclease